MEIRRDNLRRWKIEIEMDGLSEPDVAEVYESVRKHFHLKRETFGTHRLDKRWITVKDISNSVERFMSQLKISKLENKKSIVVIYR